MTIKITINNTLYSRFKEKGSFVPRKAVCGEAGLALPVQQCRLGLALDMFRGRTDAQFFPKGCQGLLPPPLVVEVEDTWGPAPVLDCPRDQLREQHLQVPVG